MRVRHFLVGAVALLGLVGLTAPPAAAADTTSPTITLSTPKAGGSYKQGSVLKAKYSCKDKGGSGIVSCVGTYANGATLPTQIAGERSFKVIATDGAGNITKKEVTYKIADKTAPTIDIDSPEDGATYEVGDPLVADFDCDDNTLGAGIDTCVGTVADGDPISTASAGTKTFKVTARDLAGNKATKTVRYRVVNP